MVDNFVGFLVDTHIRSKADNEHDQEPESNTKGKEEEFPADGKINKGDELYTFFKIFCKLHFRNHNFAPLYYRGYIINISRKIYQGM
jgi:hypothetical protein